MHTKLDYDYETDLYCIKGTKTPYTGEHEMYESMGDDDDTNTSANSTLNSSLKESKEMF